MINNRHNNITTIYYLILKKHLRKGGQSIADITKYNPDNFKVPQVPQVPVFKKTKLTEESDKIPSIIVNQPKMASQIKLKKTAPSLNSRRMHKGTDPTITCKVNNKEIVDSNFTVSSQRIQDTEMTQVDEPTNENRVTEELPPDHSDLVKIQVSNLSREESKSPSPRQYFNQNVQKNMITFNI